MSIPEGPTLSLTIAEPTSLSDIQEWAAACQKLGFTPDFTTIEINGVQRSLTATIALDETEEIAT